MAGKRVIFLIVGVVAATIAIVGVWLPGVPTVFPLIVALWALSKSSQRMKQHLEKVPILRHALVEAKRFETDKSIDRRVKFIAVLSAWTSTLVVALVTRNVVITLLVAVSALACTSVMLIIPTRQRQPLAAERAEEEYVKSNESA